MEAILYRNYKKMKNSTKQPTGGETVNVRLKAGTSLAEPTLLIGNTVDYSINYFHFAGRYYFVTDIRLNLNNIFEITGSVDPLATHRAEIFDARGFVEYATSGYDPFITDDRMTMTNKTVATFTKTLPMFGVTEGTYILSVVGNNPKASVGLSQMYALNSGGINQLATKLYDTGVLEELKKLMTDPYDGLLSCMYVPFEGIPVTGDTLYIGNKNTNIECFGLKNLAVNTLTTSYTLQMPERSNDFTDYAPYTSYMLYLPFYGSIQLDPAKMTDTINVKVLSDIATGEVVYFLSNGAKWNTTVSTKAGIPLAMGQSSTSFAQGFASIGGGGVAFAGGVASAIASGGLTAPAVLGALGGIGAMSKGLQTTFTQENSGGGSTGSFANINNTIKSGKDSLLRCAVCVKFKHDVISYADAGLNGRPVMAYKRLGDCGRYVKASGLSININGFDFEKDIINQYISQGIYLE